MTRRSANWHVGWNRVESRLPENLKRSSKTANRERMASGARAKSEKNLQQVLQFADNAGKHGFKGVRFAIEMTWLLGPEICAAHIELWEANLDIIFVPKLPERNICQYDRRRLVPEVILTALHTHRSVILGDRGDVSRSASRRTRGKSANHGR